MKRITLFYLLLLPCYLVSQSFAAPLIIGTPVDVSTRLQAGFPVDFNQDGRLDYVYTENPSFIPQFYLLEQNADFSFSRIQLSANGTTIVSVSDIDADDDIDILTTNGLYENDGNDFFALATQPTDAGAFFASLDINNDQQADYFTFSNQSVLGDRLAVLISLPDEPTFDVISRLRDDISGGFALVDDILHDEEVEILSVPEDEAVIYTIESDTLSIVAQILDPRIEERAAAIIDFEGDGDQDILLVGNFQDLYLWRQQADGFADNLETLGNFERLTDIDVSDFDLDGDQDIVTTGGQGQLEVLLHENLGNGDLAPPVTLYTTPSQKIAFFFYANAHKNQVQQGDFNDDGKTDLIVFVAQNDEIIYLENTSGPISSLSEATNVQPLVLSPNPARGLVQLPSLEFDQWSVIAIYNQQGQLVQQSTAEGSNQLLVSNLPMGSYIVLGYTEKGQVYRGNLLKQ